MSQTSSLRVGAHVEQTDPIAEAAARETTLVQFFLGDPQGYKGPEVRFAGGAEGLRAAAEEAGVDLYVHAPYIVNVATTNNRIRIPSRKLLQQHMDAAAAIGARGLIVHGGHVNKADDPAKGFDNWRKAVEATDIKVPLLIENTAGGDNAMARHLDRIAGVWDAISQAEGFEHVGFCLDTCHAWAGGIELATAVEKVRAITGRIDLVHANDSRDAFGSGADRHANFGNGRLDCRRVREAGVPADASGVAVIHQSKEPMLDAAHEQVRCDECRVDRAVAIPVAGEPTVETHRMEARLVGMALAGNAAGVPGQRRQVEPAVAAEVGHVR